MKKFWQLAFLTIVLAGACAPLYADGPSGGNPPPTSSGSSNSSSSSSSSSTTSTTVTILQSLLGYLGL